MDRALADFLTENDLSNPEDKSALYDVRRIRGLLIETAREGRALSYSEILARLGFRFTRPKMRTVCRTLDAIDEAASASGEPELAVLVVRESDGLPGQGWWAGRRDYSGEWTGDAARCFVRGLQSKAYAYWS